MLNTKILKIKIKRKKKEINCNQSRISKFHPQPFEGKIKSKKSSTSSYSSINIFFNKTRIVNSAGIIKIKRATGNSRKRITRTNQAI